MPSACRALCLVCSTSCGLVNRGTNWFELSILMARPLPCVISSAFCHYKRRKVQLLEQEHVRYSLILKSRFRRNTIVTVRVLSLRSGVVHGFVTEPWYCHVQVSCERVCSSRALSRLRALTWPNRLFFCHIFILKKVILSMLYYCFVFWVNFIFINQKRS